MKFNDYQTESHYDEYFEAGDITVCPQD